MSDGLEIGRWYSFAGNSPSQRGRPVQIRRCEDDAVLGKFANGSERLILRANIGKRIEDAVPGVTEPCLICGGRQVMPTIDPTEDEPWSHPQVGTRPCPNCRGLH